MAAQGGGLTAVPLAIAVAGCGPGGMASALLLARLGHRVTLFERFDAPQPVGSGLLIQPSGQAVLARLGLLAETQRMGARVIALRGLAGSRRALAMEYRHIASGAHAIGIHRAHLFDILFGAIRRSGIEVVTGSTLVGAKERDAAVQPLFLGVEEKRSFDLLVDATGANSPLTGDQGRMLPFGALWTTVDRPAGSSIAADALEQRYYKASRMAGIMPVGLNPLTGRPGCALFWSLRPERLARLRDEGIDRWKNGFRQLWPEAGPFVDGIAGLEELTFARYRHRTADPVKGRRVARIGDSWHATSPQLGQGANMALIDAAAVADAFAHRGKVGEALPIFAASRRTHVALYQRLSAVFTPLYQSESAMAALLRDTLVHHFAHRPLIRRAVAAIVSGNLGRPLNRIGLG